MRFKIIYKYREKDIFGEILMYKVLRRVIEIWQDGTIRTGES